ncbi:rab-GTPase-TBC domain-containing protein [Myxozyma melibiosi]|uniref:Rab-GTPase-TBC domain-containing protein n=1 Tax=Myxozyma melibiosi TaxID=54550 RepID=A0ABR1F302_9ASCO
MEARSEVSSVCSFAEDTVSSPSTAHSSVSETFVQDLDWKELEQSESECASDSNIAFLLARLDRENARFERDPKAPLSSLPAASTTTITSSSSSTTPSSTHHRHSRPVSVDQLRKIVESNDSLCVSMVGAPPPLTDLEFWTALVADYPTTASRLPCLLSKKSLFNSLAAEPSPYDKVIFRDLHRTFPEVEMFRERGGPGQQMLGQVLRAFSVYDMQVGYCQGLAFLVGPLLMHMDERAAFCVLVRLMEEYDLRTMFTADMAGLHLRIFQFSRLLERFVPALGVQNIYATQWFLSFFAVTCPLSMLLRIYDVIFAEGALETLMRVSIAIMQANESTLLSLKEEDEVLAFLLGRNLWSVYDADDERLISDAMALTTVATRQVLEELEQEYNVSRVSSSYSNGASSSISSSSDSKAAATTDLHAAATRFLGRIWSTYSAPSSTSARSVRRQSSRSSLTSSVAQSEYSTNTDADNNSQFFFDDEPHKADPELHRQIEDLVIALSTLQRQHASVVEELEAEKRARAEDRVATAEEDEAVQRELEYVQEKFSTAPENLERVTTFKDLARQIDDARAETEFERERVSFLKRDLDCKCSEVRDLKDQLFEIRNRYQDSQREKAKYERMLNEVRQRSVIVPAASPREDEYEYYDPPSPGVGSPSPSLSVSKNASSSAMSPTTSSSSTSSSTSSSSSTGLRELRLGRQNQTQIRSPQLQPHATFSKRSSSLFTSEDIAAALQSPNTTPKLSSFATFQSPQVTQQHTFTAAEPTTATTATIKQCEQCESLKLELVTAKTSEVIARQECEETKNKLEKLKRSFSSAGVTPSSSSSSSSGIVAGAGQNIAAPRISPQRTTPPAGVSGGESSWPKIGKFAWSR